MRVVRLVVISAALSLTVACSGSPTLADLKGAWDDGSVRQIEIGKSNENSFFLDSPGLNGGCSGKITQKDGEFETSYYCPGYGQTRGTYKLTLVDDGTLEVRQPNGSLYGTYRRSASEE